VALTYAGKYGPNHLWGQDPVSNRLVIPTAVQLVVSGTSTPATLFTDRTMTATTSNPVPTNVTWPNPGLDASGNLTFFADPGQEYDAVVTLTGGATQVVHGLRLVVDPADIGAGDVFE
jgi:hypothetical protein